MEKLNYMMLPAKNPCIFQGKVLCKIFGWAWKKLNHFIYLPKAGPTKVHNAEHRYQIFREIESVQKLQLFSKIL